MNHPIAPFLKRFFSHYLPVEKGLSIHTLKAYRDSLKLLLCHVADRLLRSVDELAVEDLTESRVLRFLDHVESVRSCSPSTRNARLAAIRSLFAFIGRLHPELLQQCRQVRSIPLKRTSPPSIPYLDENQMQALLDSVSLDSRTGLRDQALFLLLYNTGARVSEIVGLTCHDLQLDRSPQVRLHGKGNKIRSCPLWPETVTALQTYLQQRQPKSPDTSQLFLNANGDPITRFGIRYLTRKYAARAQAARPSLQLPTVNPHTLRHTTAMHLLHSGNDIYMVSYWLGHADLNTTHVYLEIDLQTKRQMLEKAEPPRIKEHAPWHKPHILQWLQQLNKNPQLFAAKRRPNPPKPSTQPFNST